MVGFSPLGSSPLGDDGAESVENYELTANSVTSGTSEANNTSLTQDHSLVGNTVETQAPSVSTIALTQEYSLTASNLAAGTPEVNQTNLTQDHGLTASVIVTGSPVVSDVTMAEDETFSAPNLLVGTPEVNTTSLTQLHDLIATSIVTDQPEATETTLSQDHQLSPSYLVTAPPEVPSVTATIVSTIELTASEILTGTPEVNTTSLVETSTLNPEDILTPFPDLGEPVDPNAIVVQEIKEIEQMFGGWPRRAYEVPDGRLVQAEREIEALTGDRVSIDRKAKSLIKFGKSADLTADTLETVWTVGGNETYVTDNTIEYISSSSAADTQTIKLECHTVSGTGTDAKFTFLVQEVTLNGQNPVALDTPVARVSHAYNANGTEIVGRVTVYENTTVVGGVPSDATKIHIDIPQGLQGSFKGATTFSDSDYYVLTGGFGSVSKKQDANVDFYLEVREVGGVFIQRAAVSASTGGPWDIDLDPAVIVPKNADVRIRADSGTNNAVVFGIFKGYLAKVLN